MDKVPPGEATFYYPTTSTRRDLEWEGAMEPHWEKFYNTVYGESNRRTLLGRSIHPAPPGPPSGLQQSGSFPHNTCGPPPPQPCGCASSQSVVAPPQPCGCSPHFGGPQILFVRQDSFRDPSAARGLQRAQMQQQAQMPQQNFAATAYQLSFAAYNSSAYGPPAPPPPPVRENPGGAFDAFNSGWQFSDSVPLALLDMRSGYTNGNNLPSVGPRRAFSL
eukprot:TRINITY_DN99528_c0_g1_i1.p1 TRINITY_DN99528_c0_g1~~TRINITY_DN99528_c0_g1_i1.p1  ORF type:complete len:219 (-),score=16.80 TRINITY_DN99528_c0_g1_i1:44-700(-)